MALYQQYRVNPMAGCLPMVIQIPIFLGLYNAIMRLSTSGAGLWDQGFLWLPSLAHADPWHLLPIMAGLFQFVQTQMMRPANQPKSTDPQQAMMNSIMNFMPLTVVFFGWSFAAGPVLYWATQSVYSVVQQWFITGWGNFIKWAPFLPELPEHRRLGYRPTARPGLGCGRQWRWSAGTRARSNGLAATQDGRGAEAGHRAVRGATGKRWQDSAAGPGRPKPSRSTPSRLPGRPETAPPAAGPGTASGRGRQGPRTPTASTGTPARPRVAIMAPRASAPAGAVIVPRKAQAGLSGEPRRVIGDNRWISGE